MKKETELVLVECISQFLERYVIEVPKGKAHWALDTVTMEEAKEFSQKWLGETILSHRVIKEKHYEELFDQDNDYLKDWSLDQKKEFITYMSDYQKKEPK